MVNRGREGAVRWHYFQGVRQMALPGAGVFSTERRMLALAGLLLALPSAAQYPGQVAKSSQESPELRAIAVLEWTGEVGKPKASRLVPVAVLDGGLLLGSEPLNGQLQDGGIYLARPVPLALAGAVEDGLQQNGKPGGL